MRPHAKVLVTGIDSGLGRYIHERLGGFGLRRNTTTEEINMIEKNGVDVIIHCAFNSKKDIDSESLYDYIEDNLMLTKRMVLLPHKKFVFISSVDVYPKDKNNHSEEEKIEIDSVKGMYAVTKLMSEAVVKRCSSNHLILRPSALLGIYSRRNSLIRILEDAKCDLSLSGESIFNYILYSDILSFIEYAMKKDLSGIFNLASSENITLSEVAGMLNRKVKFGDYTYDVGDINNNKTVSVFPSFKKTSREVITQYIKERNG